MSTKKSPEGLQNKYTRIGARTADQMLTTGKQSNSCWLMPTLCKHLLKAQQEMICHWIAVRQ
eukprot:4872026-Karenia_brevis.AAC.1